MGKPRYWEVKACKKCLLYTFRDKKSWRQNNYLLKLLRKWSQKRVTRGGKSQWQLGLKPEVQFSPPEVRYSPPEVQYVHLCWWRNSFILLLIAYRNAMENQEAYKLSSLNQLPTIWQGGQQGFSIPTIVQIHLKYFHLMLLPGY